MEVRYELTVDDFRQGIRAYQRKSALNRWTIRLVSGLAFLSIALGIVGLIAQRNAAAFEVWFLFAFGAVWLALVYGGPYLSARSQFRGTPSTKGQITLDISQAGIRWRSPFADSSVAWPTFVTWVEEERVFAVFTTPRIFFAVPKRAFSADQINEFREMLRSHIGKGVSLKR